MADIIRLDASQIARYHVEGYLSLDAISTAEEVARVRRIYDDLFAREAGRERGDAFDLFGSDDGQGVRSRNIPQILGPEQYAPELKETRIWRNVEAIAAQLFGAPPRTLGSHAILKPAGSPLATPWHQDEAYWGKGFDYCSFSVWVPLQDVDGRSGCMHFLPRSHWGDILPHQSFGKDPRIHGLELVEGAADLAGAEQVPLKAGGCTIHHHRLLHYTSPNQADFPRRAWILVAGAEPRRRAQPKHLPWIDRQQTLRSQRAEEWKAQAAPAA